MDMSALPRSEVSFRRSGSSGLVWDDKLLSGELKQVKTTSGADHEREREPQSYRTVETKPTIEPPSPKVSGCGVCGIFGKPAAKNNNIKTKNIKSQKCKKNRK